MARSHRLRLERQAKIPKGFQPKVEMLWRLVQEIALARQHFTGNLTHWRDSPARRRLLANRQRVAELLERLRQQDSKKANVIEQELQKRLQEICHDEA